MGVYVSGVKDNGTVDGDIAGSEEEKMCGAPASGFGCSPEIWARCWGSDLLL